MIPTFFGFMMIALFSGLAFWKLSPPVFMIVAGLSMMLGLLLPDLISSPSSTTAIDLTLGWALIAYGLFCIGSAYRCMFWREETKSEAD